MQLMQKLVKSNLAYRFLSLFLVGVMVWNLTPRADALTPICGLEEHVHDEICYAVYGDGQTLDCKYQDLIHQHDKSCYDRSGNLICYIADFVIHVHESSCYDDAGSLICNLPEVNENVHELDYENGLNIQCVYENYNRHVHTDICYQYSRELVCEESEDLIQVDHTHKDECYVFELTCGQEEYTEPEDSESSGDAESSEDSGDAESFESLTDVESSAESADMSDPDEFDDVAALSHVHDDLCYTKVLKCEGGYDLVPGHVHNDDCYEVHADLICGETDESSNSNVSANPDVQICHHYVYETHKHDASCYQDGVIACNKYELSKHEHIATCFTREILSYDSESPTCNHDQHKHGISCYFESKSEELQYFIESYDAFKAEMDSGEYDLESDRIAIASAALEVIKISETLDKEILELESVQEMLEYLKSFVPDGFVSELEPDTDLDSGNVKTNIPIEITVISPLSDSVNCEVVVTLLSAPVDGQVSFYDNVDSAVGAKQGRFSVTPHDTELVKIGFLGVGTYLLRVMMSNCDFSANPDVREYLWEVVVERDLDRFQYMCMIASSKFYHGDGNDNRAVSEFEVEKPSFILTPSDVYMPKFGNNIKSQAREMLADMTLEEKVGQMFLLHWPTGNNTKLQEYIDAYHVGGLILFDADVQNESISSLQNKIQSAQDQSKLPLIISVDEEGGKRSNGTYINRISNHSQFGHAPFVSPQELYAAGGYAKVYSDGVDKAGFLKNLKFNLNHGPVCDLSQTGYVSGRSFGPDGIPAAEYAVNAVRGLEEHNIGSTLKHFPGYGNTGADTHAGFAVNDLTEEQIRYNDLLPFYGGMAAGSRAVMVTHNIYEAFDSNNPASCSSEVYKLLREMGFDGVAITDDLNMGAITSKYGANNGGLAAIKAGADIALTVNPVEITSVLNAVKSGDISETQIDKSVERILSWKIEKGLIEAENPDVPVESEAEFISSSGEVLLSGKLSDVWDYANQNGNGTVKLLRGVVNGNALWVKNSFALDLNGCDLRIDVGVDTNGLVISGNYNFEILDSSFDFKSSSSLVRVKSGGNLSTIDSVYEEHVGSIVDGSVGQSAVLNSDLTGQIYYTDMSTVGPVPVRMSFDLSACGSIGFANGYANADLISVRSSGHLKFSGGVLSSKSSAINCAASSIEIDGGYIVNCQDSGVKVSGNSDAFMTGGMIMNNTSDYGGGVHITQSGFALSGGFIAGCTSNFDGGGVYVDSGASFESSGGHVVGNTAGRYGGGVYGNSAVNVQLFGVDIAFNKANNAGGVGFDASMSGLSYLPKVEFGDDARICYNQATGNGGGILFGDSSHVVGNVIARDIYVQGNRSVSGAGIYIGDMNANADVLDNIKFHNNEATGNGGAIYFANYIKNLSEFEVKNCEFKYNMADSYGGNVYMDGGRVIASNIRMTNELDSYKTGWYYSSGDLMIRDLIMCDKSRFWIVGENKIKIRDELSTDSIISVGLRVDDNTRKIIVIPDGSLDSCGLYLKLFVRGTEDYELLTDSTNIVIGQKLESGDRNPVVTLKNLTLQFYSDTVRPKTVTTAAEGTIRTVVMRKGNMPKNGVTPESTLLKVGSTGRIETESVLTKIYDDNVFSIEEEISPKVKILNRFDVDASQYYDCIQIWIGDAAYANSILATNFRVIDYNHDLYLTNDESDTNPNAVFVSDNQVVRFVAKPIADVYQHGTVFYDYDITDGQIYGTEANASKFVNPLASSRRPANNTDAVSGLYVNVDYQGINSPENYGKSSFSSSDLPLTFGNANTGVLSGRFTVDGYQYNMANTNNTSHDINVVYTTSPSRSHFGLVQGLDSNGNIVWNSKIVAPKMFNEGSAVGKTSYGLDEYALNFIRSGDSYTLDSVIDVDSGSYIANNLRVLGHTGGYAHIWSNDYWPMDVVSSYNTDGHDVAFGAPSDANGGIRACLRSGGVGALPVFDDSTRHNAYFGMYFSVGFTLEEDFVAPLSYYFFGDDDLYVFLDGELVCDIGGVHRSVGGYVDLREWLPVDDPNTPGNHELTVYYLERGASGSTCWMHMQLPHPLFMTTKEPPADAGYGHLELLKSVIGIEDTAEKFDIKVELLDKSGNELNLDGIVYSGDSSGVIHSGEVIQIGKDEKLTLKNIPLGTIVRVTEILSDSQLSKHWVVGGPDSNLTSKSEQVLNIDISDEFQSLKIQNTYQTPGQLQIKKTVVDDNLNQIDSDAIFPFRVYLRDADNLPVSSQYNYYIYPIGVEPDGASYTMSGVLAHDKTVMIPANSILYTEDIMDDISYEIVELTLDGYEQVSQANTSNAIANNVQVAEFVNTTVQYYAVLPKTGGPGIINYVISGAAFMCLATLLICRRKTKSA